MTAPRRSPQRARTLAEIAADTDAGRHYRYALGIEPRFAQALVDGGFVEIKLEGRSRVDGQPIPHLYLTDLGRELLAAWQPRQETR